VRWLVARAHSGAPSAVQKKEAAKLKAANKKLQAQIQKLVAKLAAAQKTKAKLPPNAGRGGKRKTNKAIEALKKLIRAMVRTSPPPPLGGVADARWLRSAPRLPSCVAPSWP
jgi:hypothetical protein